LGLFIAITVVMTYPLAFRAGDTIENYGDPLLNTWIMAWDVHQLTSDPLHLFDANIFHPYRNTLAYSENLMASAVLAAPIIQLTGNPILAYNLMVLLSFVLAGFAAYLLICYHTGSWCGGVVAGLAFAFAHYRFGQFSHLQLLTSQWMPLALLYLSRFMRSRSTKDALLFALFFAAQSLSCIYYAFYTTMAVVLYLLYLIPARRLSLDARLLRGAALAFLLAAIAIVPLSLPYLAAGGTMRGFPLEAQAGAVLADYLAVSGRNPLREMPPFNLLNHSKENAFFPGAVALSLAAVGLAVRRRGGEWGFFVLLASTAFILSLGTHFRLSKGHRPTFMLPYTLLYRSIPLLKAMRVPARLVVLVMLGIAALAGWGASHLAGRKGAKVLLPLLILAMIVEYWGAPVRAVPIEAGAEVPEVYRWLRAHKGGAILELPSVASFGFLSDGVSIPRLARHQYFSTYHWHPMIMGYSAFYPSLFWEGIEYVRHFPSLDSIAYLRGLGVRYVIIHSDELGEEEWEAMQREIHNLGEAITPRSAFGADYIYELPPAKLREPRMEIICPSKALAGDDEYYAYLILHNPSEGAIVRKEREGYQVTFEWRTQGGEVVSGTRRGRFPLVYAEGDDIIPLLLPPPPSDGARLAIAVEAWGKKAKQEQLVELISGPSELEIPPNLIRVEADFGGLELTHAYLPRGTTYRPGEVVNVTLYWRRKRSLESLPVAFVHILDRGWRKVAQRDMYPANGLYPTTAWQSEEVVMDRHLITLPSTLFPGRYQIVAGLYDSSSLRELGERAVLTFIEVPRPQVDISAIQHPTRFILGDVVEFLGYDLKTGKFKLGGKLRLTIYWRAKRRMERDYTVFVHLLDENGRLLAQADSQPQGGNYPTSSWREGEVIEDRYELTIPRDASLGELQIEVGMYLLDTMERLPVFDELGRHREEDRILLMGMHVDGPGRSSSEGPP